MKIDNLRKYVDLRNSLTREKAQLEERLRQINDALGEASLAPAAPSQQGMAARGGKRGRPAASGLSLREAVLQATSQQALTKQEILDAVKQMGYRFSTNNPMNSLGVILYGKNPRFKNDNGRFSPAGGAGRSGGGSKSSNGAFTRRKRTLSPEARERIAAAQRARWAKTKGGK